MRAPGQPRGVSGEGMLNALNPQRQAARRADAIIISVPKSGRTWLRVLIQTYRSGGRMEGFSLSAQADHELPPPTVYFTHERWDHRTTPSLKEVVLRAHLLPVELLWQKPVILLVRDPRDVMVSLYFEETRRRRKFLEASWRQRQPLVRTVDWLFMHLTQRSPFAGSMGDFLRHPVTGIRPIVRLMNDWLWQFSRLPRFRLVRYEDLHRSGLAAFRDVLLFLGAREINDEVLARVWAFGSYENMRRLEATGMFDERLQPADQADPESFKVRRGKVGGYVDYLSPGDIAWLNQEIGRLDPRFGYGHGNNPTPRRSGRGGGQDEDL